MPEMHTSDSHGFTRCMIKAQWQKWRKQEIYLIFQLNAG